MPDRNTSGQQDERKDRGNHPQTGRDDKDQRSSGAQKKGRNNPGNFANDPERASEAGRKGGRS